MAASGSSVRDFLLCADGDPDTRHATSASADHDGGRVIDCVSDLCACIGCRGAIYGIPADLCGLGRIGQRIGINGAGAKSAFLSDQAEGAGFPCAKCLCVDAFCICHRYSDPWRTDERQYPDSLSSDRIGVDHFAGWIGDDAPGLSPFTYSAANAE